MAVKTKYDAFLRQREQSWLKVRKEDAAAKAAGTLVGRYINEGIANGYAIYKIVRENNSTVRIKVVTGLGDGWQIPYWGSEATIDKYYALNNIERREFLAKMFRKPRKGANNG